MTGRGHRKLRLSSKKNYERKKYFKSVPQAATQLLPLHVSIPLSVFKAAPAESITALHSRLVNLKILELIEGWKMELHVCERFLKFYCLESDEKSGGIQVSLSVTVNSDFSFMLFWKDKKIDSDNCAALRDISSTLDSVSKVTHFLRKLAACHQCLGNSDESFLRLPNIHNRIMKDHSRTHVVAVVDSIRSGSQSIHHIKCEILVDPSSNSKRCLSCTQHRKALASMVTRANRPPRDDHTHPSSHTTYAALCTPEKDERLRRLHLEAKKSKLQIHRLQEKIDASVHSDPAEVDTELDKDLRDIVAESKDYVKASYPEGSFQKIFWEQQQKAMSLRDSRSMKWHPLFVKWCLYLRHHSGKSYEMLRQSGCIQLPSQRTLRDYTHYISTRIGFSAEIDQSLISSLDLSIERNRYVVLVMDEVHVKADLVYDKFAGKLIGFVNLGETNNHLLDFENALAGRSDVTDCPLANSMFVLMVRGLFSHINFPYAQFACHTLTGELLVDPVWEAISRLERQGIRVLALTCDGASSNRRLWKMHSNEKDVYKVDNIFARDGPRPLFFISDPPHLLKTTRNNMWNPKKSLWCNGRSISWKHLEQLYQHDTENIMGLRLAPKLKYEHIYLSTFSKMRVDLAAQTLSETVANGIQMVVGEDASETVKFVRMMDRFFDCFNVNNFCTGIQKRKVFQEPYRKAEDFRLKWLQEEFLPYLAAWETSVSEREGFSSKQKEKMLLSSETRHGLRVTVHSFVELVRFVFTIPDVTCFLSERLSQDPLEKFFGCQRQRGGTSENPSIAEFCKNTQALRVITSACTNVSRGNCRGNVEQLDIEEQSQPLSKRRRKHK